MTIVDMYGRPLPDADTRKRAEEDLKEFIEKNKRKFEEWLQRKGPVAFPVKYNAETRKWFWIETE